MNCLCYRRSVRYRLPVVNLRFAVQARWRLRRFKGGRIRAHKEPLQGYEADAEADCEEMESSKECQKQSQPPEGLPSTIGLSVCPVCCSLDAICE